MRPLPNSSLGNTHRIYLASILHTNCDSLTDEMAAKMVAHLEPLLTLDSELQESCAREDKLWESDKAKMDKSKKARDLAKYDLENKKEAVKSAKKSYEDRLRQAVTKRKDEEKKLAASRNRYEVAFKKDQKDELNLEKLRDDVREAMRNKKPAPKPPKADRKKKEGMKKTENNNNN